MAPVKGTVKENVDKLFEDMYLGTDSDNPPVTVRLDRLERSMADINKLKWAMIITILTLIGDIVSNHIKVH